MTIMILAILTGVRQCPFFFFSSSSSSSEKNGEGYDGTFDYYEDDGGETSFFLLGEEVIDYDSPIWD